MPHGRGEKYQRVKFNGRIGNFAERKSLKWKQFNAAAELIEIH